LADSHATTHHSALAHHFDNMEQQREAGNLGCGFPAHGNHVLWRRFYGLYCLPQYTGVSEAFVAASNTLNVPLGLINTAVLIISSLTMALAVYYAQTGSKNIRLYFCC
jgi:cytochrome c oxidase subunit 3